MRCSLTKLGERTFAEAKVAWQAAQDEFETQFGRDRAKALRDELFSVTANARRRAGDKLVRNSSHWLRRQRSMAEVVLKMSGSMVIWTVLSS